MNQTTLISVIGPTAIGKTQLAIRLAQCFKTDILSADSRQFYKEMNIGTAVPSKEELQMATHHFIQHKSIFDTYTVGDFEKDALLKLDEVFQKNDIAVLVGGSGLYVDAVIEGLDIFPKVSEGIREELIRLQNEKGLEYLQQQLQVKDPEYFKKVDIENPHRLIRALEVCMTSGKPYSSFLNQKKTKRNFRTVYIGISANRALIYKRINERVDLMLANGLLNEAKDLYKHKNLNALQTVGYQELFKFFDGDYDLEFAIKEIKKNTRRFAKRQLTWYRKNDKILWIDFMDKPDDIIAKIRKSINYTI